MVVGRLLSYWGPVTFQGRTVKLREGKKNLLLEDHPRKMHTCHTIHGTGVYLPTWMADFYGKCRYINLEPKWPLFLKVNPPKQSRNSNQNNGHLRVPGNTIHGCLGTFIQNLEPLLPKKKTKTSSALANPFHMPRKLKVTGSGSVLGCHENLRDYEAHWFSLIKP